MDRFYGGVQGTRGQAHRLGTAKTGITTVAASYQGAIEVRLRAVNGLDRAEVRFIPWRGVGADLPIYSGPVSGPLAGNPRRASGRGLVLYAHREPTDDPMGATGKLDVVLYRDRQARSFYARWPWHGKPPTRSTRSVNMAGARYALAWLPDRR